MSTEPVFVLWGYNPDHMFPNDTTPAVIRLEAGTMNECSSENSFRVRTGWVTGIYREGDEPAGLRQQCARDHGRKATANT